MTENVMVPGKRAGDGEQMAGDGERVRWWCAEQVRDQFFELEL
jgi:hypothetical protein